ncbi:MAG: hypothetical protein NC310_02025 [Roseburia sp.]|nr:hypothetical protein [Roseburia sp.]MCM1556303.1 hypothetical protein [Anaeroplasma bactoclasticum]
MVKITKSILKYFTIKWTLENRKKILKTFKIGVQKRKIVLNDKVEEKTFERKIKVYDKSNPIFEEFLNIEIGDENWYKNLTFISRKYIIDTCKKWEKEDNARPPIFYTPRQMSFLDNQMERLRDYFLSDESYYCFLRKDLELRESAIQKFIFNRKTLYSPVLLLDKVKIYAIQNNLNYFNKRGNLLPVVIKRYLSGELKIPMSKEEKIKRSIKRTEIEFKRLVRTNINDFENFVTLTFANKEDKDKYEELNQNSVKHNEYDLKFTYVDNAKDYESCIKKMNAFFSNLRRDCKTIGIEIKYVGVPEYQKNGNIHYHFLMSYIPKELLYDVPSWLDYDVKIKGRRYDKGIKRWSYGKSTIETIEDKQRMIEYVSKYLEKGFEEIKETDFLERLNKRRYYYSQNLEKPKIEYFTEEIEENPFDEESTENVNILYESTSLNYYNQTRTIVYENNNLGNFE